jgi:cytochrome c oxidase assembly factor CtaG
MSRIVVLLLLLTLLASPAGAHTAAPEAPWPGPEPWMLIPMLAAVAVYVTGFARLRARSDHGRGEGDRRARFFALGIAVLAGATLSPLHQLGGHSFAAHMTEHELIMLAAAPVLVLARPLGVMLWAFPAGGRRALAAIARSRAGSGLWRTFSDPWLATILQGAALWIWHLPSLFDRALKSEAWHVAQHLSFFAAALLFWSAMLGPRRSAWTAAACLFATSMITGALGAFMTLSQSPWYGPYASLGLAAFGLTPAQDQELAGALMWVPGGLIHAVVAVALLAPVLRGSGTEEAADAEPGTVQ